MADEAHLKILRRGEIEWDRWRRNNPYIAPDFSGADLHTITLSGTNLSNADFSGANLYGAQFYGVNFSGSNLGNANFGGAALGGARFIGADLRGADFSWANLSEAELDRADLSGANLYGAKLYNVNLSGADLREANLSETDLSETDLSGANLGGAYLHEANFVKADLSDANLSYAVCKGANFSNVNLTLARLLNTYLDGATLTRAWLWETQRAGWSIKGLICESVYWDREGKELTTYCPGEFEQLYADRTKIVLFYKGGLSPLEFFTLPALVKHLEETRPGCTLRLESITHAAGGAVVTLAIDEAGDGSPEGLTRLKAEMETAASRAIEYQRKALAERETRLRLEGEVKQLGTVVDKLILRPSLSVGGITMGDEYNVGQAGAVGPNAHAHDMTFQQIGGNIEKSMDLSELASELVMLREAMSREAKETGHYIAIGDVAKAEEAAKAKDSSKVAESLKAAGKWTLDVATKIGTSLATEALKESMGMK